MAAIEVLHRHYVETDAAHREGVLRNLGAIMATQQELIQTLQDVLAQQTKTAGEIAALQASIGALHETITALEGQIAQAGNPSPELVAAVAAVKAKAAEVDGLIPDPPPAT